MENRGWEKFLLILPVAVAFVLFWPTLKYEYAWDERQFLTELLPAYQNVKDAFTPQGHFGLPIYYYRPLFWLTFMLQRSLWGIEPAYLHASMVALHALVTLLVYLVTWKLLQNHRGALAASLLFAVHPIHTEVVCWIAGFPDASLTLFLLTSFFSYLMYRSPSKRVGWLFFSVFSFGLALFTKETAVVFLLCLILYDLFFPPDTSAVLSRQERKHPKREGRRFPFYPRQIGFGVLVVVYFLLRRRFLEESSLPKTSLGGGIDLIRNGVNAYGYYFREIFRPSLNAYVAELPNDPFLILGILFLLLSFGVIAIAYRKNKALVSFHILFFLLTLLPAVAVAIIPVAKMVAAERYLYLPSYPFCFLAGLVLVAPSGKKTAIVKTLIFLLLLGTYGYKSFERSPAWKNSKVFWRVTSEQNPTYALPLQNLAGAYQRENKNEEALVYYHKALKAQGDTESRATALNAMGAIEFGDKNYEEGIRLFKEAIQTRPTYVLPYCNLGSIYYFMETKTREEKRGNLQNSIHYLKECIERRPKETVWRDRMGLASEELRGLQ